MKKMLVVFLQVVVVLIGICAVVFLLWEPQVEGRNKHATLYQIYFNDPFLAYVYVASIPFFVALRQAFKVLGYVGQGRGTSPATAGGLKIVKYCAIATIGLVAIGEIFILLGESDDHAGGVFMGVLITFGAIVTTIGATMIERRVRKAMGIVTSSG